MINKIYELEDGKEYIILLEEDMNNTKYALVAECNLANDYINEDELILKEVINEDNNVAFKSVDKEEANDILVTMLGKASL